jgi:hypothetical protein
MGKCKRDDKTFGIYYYYLDNPPADILSIWIYPDDRRTHLLGLFILQKCYIRHSNVVDVCYTTTDMSRKVLAQKEGFHSAASKAQNLGRQVERRGNTGFFIQLRRLKRILAP